MHCRHYSQEEKLLSRLKIKSRVFEPCAGVLAKKMVCLTKSVEISFKASTANWICVTLAFVWKFFYGILPKYFLPLQESLCSPWHCSHDGSRQASDEKCKIPLFSMPVTSLPFVYHVNLSITFQKTKVIFVSEDILLCFIFRRSWGNKSISCSSSSGSFV